VILFPDEETGNSPHQREKGLSLSDEWAREDFRDSRHYSGVSCFLAKGFLTY